MSTEANSNDQQSISGPDEHKYWTQLPNVYDDADLTLYEFRLLVHYKRVGSTYESTRTTAKLCRMSLGSVVKARTSLAKKGWVKLSASDQGTIAVALIDIWEQNTAIYGGSKSKRSPGEHPIKDVHHMNAIVSSRSPHERSRSRSGIKEEPPKEEATDEEEPENSRPSAARPDAIELHRRLTHRYLHKSTWPTINRVVGSGFPALLRWGRLVRAWKLAGYNVTNAKGMLEVYRNGWERRGPPGAKDPNYSAAKDTAEFNRKRAAAREALGQAKRPNREAVDG